MRQPFLDNPIVPEAKIAGYLLSFTHPQGRHKAAFFTRFGFAAGSWETMASALLRHAHDHEVSDIKPGLSGMRYTVEGRLHAPDGRSPFIRAVWFIRDGEDAARFVTAYPLDERRQGAQA